MGRRGMRYLRINYSCSMKSLSLVGSLMLLSNALVAPVFGQQAPASSATSPRQVFKKTLPADLPTAKLLFIKHSPVAIPAERPANMTRRNYKLLEQHAVNFPHANEQLEKAVQRYPFAHRITTQDSVAYYQAKGYKYVLFHQSFNAFTEGRFSGTRGNSPTMVDLYVQDLGTGDRYIVEDFSETFIYYYKGLVGMLLKRVDKQFDAKK